MVDQQGTLIFEYPLFRGINLRDDENKLPLGESPDAQNFELLRRTGLRKKKGWTNRYNDFSQAYAFMKGTNFTNKYNEKSYLSVSYPFLLQHDKTNGFTTTLDNTLSGDGEPYFFPLTDNQKMLVDGANAPRLIGNDGSVTTVSWPPTYSTNNNAVLDESNLATAANPSTFGSDIGYPSFGALYENRAWLAGDKLAPNRIYVSKLLDYDDFGTNSGATFDVAFFVDVQTGSPITALKVINNQFLVIYCESEIHVLSGKFPPASGFPTPHFRIDSLNPFVGCLSPRLVVDKGDNDHFFVANNGVIYTLTNTDNFADVRPLGLSSKIFPALSNLDNETFKRGFLVNHNIRGELYFFFPNQNYRRFSNQAFIYNYTDGTPEDPQWSPDRKFGETYPVDAFIDSETNDMIILTRDQFLTANEGLSYNGQAIDMYYQLATLDFGDPDIRKEIVNITIYATNFTNNTTNLLTYHMWEDNEAGFTQEQVVGNIGAVFGEATFGNSVWQSFAGKPFTKIEFKPNNPIGKILKFRIRHQEEADIFIHSIIFRYRVLGR